MQVSPDRNHSAHLHHVDAQRIYSRLRHPFSVTLKPVSGPVAGWREVEFLIVLPAPSDERFEASVLPQTISPDTRAQLREKNGIDIASEREPKTQPVNPQARSLDNDFNIRMRQAREWREDGRYSTGNFLHDNRHADTQRLVCFITHMITAAAT